jgi:LuxR family glucitol operon transcriptional activator
MVLSKIALLLFKVVLQSRKYSQKDTKSGTVEYLNPDANGKLENIIGWIIAEQIFHDLIDIDIYNRNPHSKDESQSDIIPVYYGKTKEANSKDNTVQKIIALYSDRELLKNQYLDKNNNLKSILILMALALFPKPALFESICNVAGLKDDNTTVEAFAKLQQLSLISCKQARYTMLPLTREYALCELFANPEFESDARERWIDYYIDISQKYGGKYEKEWNDYQELEAEWDNLCEVIEWCIAEDRYSDACSLWQYINCYTYSQGYRQNRLSYWDAPLHWLQWLIEAAQKRQDNRNTAVMMSDYAWKLILIGHPQHLKEADKLLSRAWKLRQHLTAKEQANLAIRIVVWYIQLKQFGFAKFWIDQVQTILDDSYIEESVSIRISLQILYYKGEIYYKNGDYERSQLLFQEVVQESRKIGWQRMIFLGKDFLADISIKQGKLKQAQQFLIEGIQIAQDNRDNCSKAYMMRSLARLEMHQGNFNLAVAWASKAKAGFDGLGMVSEAEESQDLLYGE